MVPRSQAVAPIKGYVVSKEQRLRCRGVGPSDVAQSRISKAARTSTTRKGAGWKTPTVPRVPMMPMVRGCPRRRKGRRMTWSVLSSSTRKACVTRRSRRCCEGAGWKTSMVSWVPMTSIMLLLLLRHVVLHPHCAPFHPADANRLNFFSLRPNRPNYFLHHSPLIVHRALHVIPRWHVCVGVGFGTVARAVLNPSTIIIITMLITLTHAAGRFLACRFVGSPLVPSIIPPSPS